MKITLQENATEENEGDENIFDAADEIHAQPEADDEQENLEED